MVPLFMTYDFFLAAGRARKVSTGKERVSKPSWKLVQSTAGKMILKEGLDPAGLSY